MFSSKKIEHNTMFSIKIEHNTTFSMKIKHNTMFSMKIEHNTTFRMKIEHNNNIYTYTKYILSLERAGSNRICPKLIISLNTYFFLLSVTPL